MAAVVAAAAAPIGDIVLVNPSILEHLPDLVCVICQEVLRDPVQTPCLHTFCRACLLPNIALRPECPTDRAALKVEDLRSFQDANPGAYRMLFGSLKVHCPLGKGLAGDGICQWRGDYTGMNTHIDTNCSMAMVNCGDCKVAIVRAALVEHAAICVHRTVVCQYCAMKLPFDTVTEHVATICDGAPVTCETLPETKLSASIPGCGRSVARAQLGQHQRSECLKGIVKCPLAVHGCAIRVSRELLDTHETEYGRQHTRLLSARLTEITERFARFASMMMSPEGKQTPLPPTNGNNNGNGAVSPTAATAVAPAPVWETKTASAPYRIYIMGGVGCDRRDTGACVCFDTKDNKWITLPSMPSVCGYNVAAPFGRTLYSYGGYQTATGTRLDVARAYSSTARGGTWRALPSMLHARAGHQVLVYNTQHWIIGGNDNDGQATNTCAIFDPSTDTWVSGAPLIMARTQHMATVLRGVMYVMGGSATSNNNDLLPASCEYYDPTLRRWQPCSPPATRRCGGVAVADDNTATIYVMGGYTPPSAAARDRNPIINNSVEIATYQAGNSGTLVWTSATWTLPRPLARFAAVATVGTTPGSVMIVIAGGVDDKNVVQNNSYAISYAPSVSAMSVSISALPPLPSAVYAMAFSSLPSPVELPVAMK